MPYKQDNTSRLDCTGGADSVALLSTLTLTLPPQAIGVSFVIRNEGAADGYIGYVGETYVSAVTVPAGGDATVGDYISSSLGDLTLFGLVGADLYITPQINYRG